jgi:hypothetical protein
VAVGNTSASKSITLTNRDNGTLYFSSITTTGDFAVASNTCGASVGGGTTCTVGITFSPTAIGARTGTLTFADDAVNSPQIATLTGTGTAPVTLSTSSLTFAARSVGTTSAVHNVTLTNHLTGPVAIYSVLVNGDFAVANNTCGSSVAAGVACEIGVTFTPTAVGTRTGTLTINDSAYGSPLLVSLTGTGNASGLVSIALTPANPSIALGLTQQFAATGTFTGGRKADLTTSVTWSSLPRTVATINAAGLASSASQGSATITATLNAIKGSTTLSVTAPVLESIAVTPANASIAAGTTQQFTATGTYSDGSKQNLTSTATWSSSAPGVATISTTGLASAVAPGQTTIEAASGAINGSTTLTVTAGFVLTGSLNTARSWHTATLLNNGMVLMAGGIDPSGALASTELYNPVTGTFTPTGSLNTARYLHTATLLTNGMVLIAGGYGPLDGSTYGYLASAELYNPATGTFTPTGSLNTARYSHTATLLTNGMVLIAGGYGPLGGSTHGYLASAELYNPATGIFAPTGSLNTGRAYHTATLLNNGLVLIAGGLGSSGSSASAELYNPATGTFAATGSLNTARCEHTGTLLNNGLVLIAGGYGSSASLASAELYNPATGTFTPTGSLNTARDSHTATLLNDGMVLMAGGENSSGTSLADVELYNPATGTFAGTVNLNTARQNHTATLLNNGMVLMAGGFINVNVSPYYVGAASGELYEPATLTPPNLMSIEVTPATSTLSPGTTQQFIATGTLSDSSTEQLASVTWSSSDTALAQITNDASNHGLSLANAAGTVTIAATAGSVSGSATLTVRPTGFVDTGSLNDARYAHTATLLNNGMVLMAGGYGDSGLIAGAELFAPATGTFTPTGSLHDARYEHTATLLSNGMVLIAGGIDSSGFPTTSAELYNPANGTFTPTGSLNTARCRHTATLLNNGTVLIAGGDDSSFDPTTSAELYNPATGIFTPTGSLNTGRMQHTATLLNNGMVLVAGGVAYGHVYLASTELYNPATGTFTPGGSLNTARGQHTATLLSDGMVLMAGGAASKTGPAIASAELYNPDTGTFTPTGSLSAARWLHTATLLNSGMVLVAGGTPDGSTALASAELYDPATGTFAATGSLNTARYIHTATLLNNGMVLIAGGLGSSGSSLASAELY